MLNKELIKELLDERDYLSITDEKNPKIDEIQNEIEASFKEDFQHYEVDFIIESLTRFGAAPCVMYDDNGLFAVSGDGMQPVVTDDERIEGCIEVFVTKEQWFKTIREAVRYYLFNS